MNRIKLSDGIHLNIIESDKFKTNFLKINFTLPLDSTNASFASLLPMVLRRGNCDFPTIRELNRHLEYLYAANLGTSVLKLGETQVISFGSSFIRDEFLPGDEKLLGDVVSTLCRCIFMPYFENGKFCEDYVESEKKNLCDKILSEINNKSAFANKRMFEIMCEEEPFSISPSGTVDGVKGITAESLTMFYNDIFTKLPMEIFFVGMAPQDELIQLLSEQFKNKICGNTSAVSPVIKTSADKVKRMTEEMAVSQGKLAMGFRTGASSLSGNAEEFILFNEIFGGSPTSKLFENVREKLSLCYYCSSRFISQKGIMHISSGVKVGDEVSAEAEIMHQLEEMRSGSFTEQDIAEAKLSLKNGYLGLLDDAERISDFYLARVLTGETEATVASVIERIEACGREKIIEMAKSVSLDTVYFLKGTLPDSEEKSEE